MSLVAGPSGGATPMGDRMAKGPDETFVGGAGGGFGQKGCARTRSKTGTVRVRFGF